MAKKTKQFPKIDANPTKTFFISMLVRDIDLLDSIIDLVDNSVDGARSLRPKTTKSSPRYKGLVVELTLNENEFRIEDNCGGIAADHAQHYVFNFGRKPDYPTVSESVGQFGVGMKRALFKIGKHFRIESRAEESAFVVDVDVPSWQKSPENPWEFDFDEYEPSIDPPTDETDRFTNVIVNDLHPAVAAQFKLDHVINHLSTMLGAQHQASMELGLDILVNGSSVARRTPSLVQSQVIKPLRVASTVDVDGSDVEIEVFAGLAESGQRELAGWYIYCNDRLVVGADKTELTGWGRTGGGTLPEYHPEFRKFRGYVFLSAEDASKLPWNTTKTSVDTNSVAYSHALRQMIVAMQQVLGFITDADKELESYPKRGGPLNKAIAAAEAVGLDEVEPAPKFITDIAPAPVKKKQPTINYKVDADKLEEVKDEIGVSSNKEAGLATFNYYYSAVIE